MTTTTSPWLPADYFVVGLPNTTLSTTSTKAFGIKYALGETIPIVAGYNLPTNLTTITVFQVTKTDSAQVGSYPVSSTSIRCRLLTP